MLTTSLLSSALLGSVAAAQSIKTYVDSLDLEVAFNPVKAGWWHNLPHHRRTPFAISPDGKNAYIAYVDGAGTDVHVQQVDPSTFASVGSAVTIEGGWEAAGLVAHNDGFAAMTNINITGPPGDGPVAWIIRYANGKEAWRTALSGPSNPAEDGGEMWSPYPDFNGDLVYSEKARLYGAYYMVTAYSGFAKDHYGDNIMYVDEKGALKKIPKATSYWGCSHNMGIAFENADEPPYASICSDDHGSIWLNTLTQSMNKDSIKIANENSIQYNSGEPMGGFAGSYSVLALFPGTTNYLFAWGSRGSINLRQDDFMGPGYVNSDPRTKNHNVALASMTDKATLVGPQASSEVGAASGDDQVNWLTKDEAEHTSIHVEAFDNNTALVTWEEIASPTCEDLPGGCKGVYTGTKFQLVDAIGKPKGEPVTKEDVYVAGDITRMPDGRLCWPYVNMKWDLSKPTPELPKTSAKKMSFACASLNGAGSDAGTGSTGTSNGTTITGGPTSGGSTTSSASASVSTSPAASPAPGTSGSGSDSSGSNSESTGSDSDNTGSATGNTGPASGNTSGSGESGTAYPQPGGGGDSGSNTEASGTEDGGNFLQGEDDTCA